jgi:hypothetical protein
VFWYFSFMRGMFWYISKFYRNIRELYEIYQIVPERKFYGIPLGKNPRTTTASKRAKYIRSFFAKSLASSIRVRIRDRNRGDFLWRPAAACFKEKVLARLETWRSITWFRGVHWFMLRVYINIVNKKNEEYAYIRSRTGRDGTFRLLMLS